MSRDFRLPWGQQHKPLGQAERWRGQATLLGLSPKAKKKLEWFVYYKTRGSGNASRTARYFGISKSVFYKWRAVFDPQNLKALEEGSRAPVTRREFAIPREQEDGILALRKHSPEYGKMKLKTIYERENHKLISSWKIQRVIEKYRLQRKPRQSDRQFQKQSVSKRKTIELRKEQRPGFLVAFDSIEIHRNGLRRYIVTGIDTVSKIAWARMYTTHSSATARDLFIRLYAVVRGNILNTCQDNGSEFGKAFAQTLQSLDIPQYFSRVKTAKDNPVCERFNGILKQEFLRQGNWTADVQEFNRRLSRWLLKYNCYRPHQSLNYLTPFQYHYSQPVLSTMLPSST
ncbi:MAG: integrase core domain-containing protein, partial [bacterium]|nr:integrase core domain-containing protein [bacterium]